MRRQLVLTGLFQRQRDRFGLTAGTPDAKECARVIRELWAEGPDLPLPGDVEMLMPPGLWTWARRIPGSGVWLVYRFTDTEVVMLSLHVGRPAPLNRN